MGLFDTIWNAVSSTATQIWSGINESPSQAAGLPKGSTFSGSGNSPISTGQSLINAIPSAVAATLAIPAAASGLLSTAIPTIESAGSKFLSNPITTTKTVATTAAAGLAGIAGVNLLATSGTARAAVLNAPSSAASLGSDIGKAIDNPSISSLSNIYKNNPVLAGGLTALGIGAAGYGLSSTVSTILNTSAVKKNTIATAASGGSANSVTDNSAVAAGTNKNDLEIAKIQAANAKDLAKIQSDALQNQNQTQIELAKLTSTQEVAAMKANPQTAAAPLAAKSKKKATPKKKKKASKKKKAKTIKRKTTKKKKKR